MREVRFFPDVGAPWCLWESSADRYAVYAAELGASAETEARITAWFGYGETHAGIFTGWDSVANRRTWRLEGREIVAALREELDGQDIEIVSAFES